MGLILSCYPYGRLECHTDVFLGEISIVESLNDEASKLILKE